MQEPAYPLARVAAARIHDHFARQHALTASHRGRDVAPLVEPGILEAVINAGFWASLQREEGYSPRISFAFAAPEQVAHPMLFEQPIELDASALAKVGPAVERPGIHLGVWPAENGALMVWGAATNLPMFCLVLEVVSPGLLVMKHSGGSASGKFINVAVLQGDQIKIIDQQAACVPDCPGLLTSLLSLESPSLPSSEASVLIQLAVSMRAHGRGGALLVSPAGTETWRESVVPGSYTVLPPFAELADLAQKDASEQDPYELRRTVDLIAGLTAVDGATVISSRYELLAFGVKIVRRVGSTLVDRVILTEPVEGVEAAYVEPFVLGGTRHLSAAQFANDQKDAIALVASQDGRFTVFGWSKTENMVHAHRIETLLL